MAFGVEYISPRKCWRTTAHQTQAVTLGVLLYATLAQVTKSPNGYSCLGCATYLIWIIIIHMYADDHSQTQQCLVQCQALLDALNVGFVVQYKDEVSIANNTAFDLLKLARGDLKSLETRLARQQTAAGKSQPTHWVPLDSTTVRRVSNRGLLKCMSDDNPGLEYTSASYPSNLS